MVQKRKREHAGRDSSANGLDTSKPTAVFKPTKGRLYTVSLALPGSIIANAQTHDLKTFLAGQIARALAVFCIDEVVIFEDGSAKPQKHQLHDESPRSQYAANGADAVYTAVSDPSNFLYHVLSYLEAPPYLRRVLFPHHPNLRTAGSLPSLDMPHHLRMDEWCPYREGVTVAAPQNTSSNAIEPNTLRKDKQKKLNKDGAPNDSAPVITHVTAGIPNPIQITLPPNSDPLPENVRLTLKFAPPHTSAPPPAPSIPLAAEAVAPDAPREDDGYYWGYTTRLAASLSDVFEESPYDDGYDFSIGTSERGEPLGGLLERTRTGSGGQLPKWRHLLIVFGGVAGLEVALKNDAKLRDNGIADVSEVFDAWVNLLEGQGSRTIRTEEAVWIGLMGLRGLVERNGALWGES